MIYSNLSVVSLFREVSDVKSKLSCQVTVSFNHVSVEILTSCSIGLKYYIIKQFKITSNNTLCTKSLMLFCPCSAAHSNASGIDFFRQLYTNVASLVLRNKR